MYRFRVPEVHEQTDVRDTMGFLITSLLRPKPQPSVYATWLMRTPANPRWHGIEATVPTGESPMDKLAQVAVCSLGIKPQYLDPLQIIQPGDYSGITRTTFVHTLTAPEQLPHPHAGIEMGAFALDALPEDLDPRLAPWLQQTLEQAVSEGLSDQRAMYISRDRQ